MTIQRLTNGDVKVWWFNSHHRLHVLRFWSILTC